MIIKVSPVLSLAQRWLTWAKHLPLLINKLSLSFYLSLGSSWQHRQQRRKSLILYLPFFVGPIWLSCAFKISTKMTPHLVNIRVFLISVGDLWLVFSLPELDGLESRQVTCLANSVLRLTGGRLCPPGLLPLLSLWIISLPIFVIFTWLDLRLRERDWMIFYYWNNGFPERNPRKLID